MSEIYDISNNQLDELAQFILACKYTDYIPAEIIATIMKLLYIYNIVKNELAEREL